MTTLSFNQADTYFSTVRAPRNSFAARLADLQIRHETIMRHADIAGVVGRSALALVPFLTLAWMFMAL